MNMLFADSDGLSTVMHVLLIRFGLIALVVAGLAVLVFAFALRLKKHGREDDLRRYGATAVRLWQSRPRGSSSASRNRDRRR